MGNLKFFTLKQSLFTKKNPCWLIFIAIIGVFVLQTMPIQAGPSLRKPDVAKVLGGLAVVIGAPSLGIGLGYYFAPKCGDWQGCTGAGTGGLLGLMTGGLAIEIADTDEFDVNMAAFGITTTLASFGFTYWFSKIVCKEWADKNTNVSLNYRRHTLDSGSKENRVTASVNYQLL